MSIDPVLGWETIEESENQPYVRSNEADERITLAGNQVSVQAISTAGGTHVLVSSIYQANQAFVLTGALSTTFTFQVPDQDRHFTVINNTNKTCTVDTVSGSTRTVTVGPDAVGVVQADNATVTLVGNVASVGGFLPKDGSVTPTGNFNWGDFKLVDVVLESYEETFSTQVSAANILTLNLDLANVFTTTLTENVDTLNVTNVSTGTANSITMFFTQNSTAFTLTWPGSFIWPSGVASTLSTGINQKDMYTAITHDDGTNWYVMEVGKNFSN